MPAYSKDSALTFKQKFKENCELLSQEDETYFEQEFS